MLSRLAATLHALFLRCYPETFRNRYADQLQATFEARFEEATVLGKGRLMVSATAGSVGHGLAERSLRAQFGDGWGRDVRLALRATRRRPVFSLTVIAVAALAVVAATVVFSVVDGTLLQPLDGSDRQVVVWGRNQANGQMRDVISGANFVDLRRGGHGFEHLAAIKPDDLVLLTGDRPEVVPTLTVTTEFFDVLGVAAGVGRTFQSADGRSGSSPVVVLSDGAARRRFGSPRAALGRALATKTLPYTVIGVLPPDFEFVAQSDFYIPLFDDVLEAGNRTSYDYWLLGRLRPDAGIDAINEQLEGVMQQLRVEDPRLEARSAVAEPLLETVTEPVRPVLLALVVAVGALLLVAAANIGGLFLMQAVAARQQVAIEASLGAGPARIARRLAAEAAAVVAVGGAVALLLVRSALSLLPSVVPPFVAIPGSAAQVASFRASFDVRTVVFVVGATIFIAGVALACNVIGAMGGVRTAAPRGGARSRTGSVGFRRAQETFVVVQVALGTLLLVAGVLGTATFTNLVSVETGLDPDGVLTLYTGDVDADNRGRALHFRRVLDSVAEVPGVMVAGLNDYVPLQAEDDFEGLSLLDRPEPPRGQGVREEWRRVSEDYFDAAGIELVAGRFFRRVDFGDTATVAIVNEAFVRRHYPGDDPVGKRILVHAREYGEAVIVGVVADVRRRGVRLEAPPVLYVPFDKRPRDNMALFVRTEGSPDAIAAAVREAVWAVDPTQPIDRVASLERVAADAIGVPRLATWVLALLAGASCVLSALGLFGVLAHAVRSRAREIGIRMALGATAGQLERSVVIRGAVLSAVGAAAGIAVAIAAARAAESLMFGVTPTDARVVSGSLAIVLLLAVGASWLPARRIAKISPDEALSDS